MAHPLLPLADYFAGFALGLPDAAFMTSRLNLPKWFPFFIGSPESWGGTSHAPKLHGIIMMPVLLHPRSRGTISLQMSTSIAVPQAKHDTGAARDSLPHINPINPPLIDPRYLASDRDVAALAKGRMKPVPYMA